MNIYIVTHTYGSTASRFSPCVWNGVVIADTPEEAKEYCVDDSPDVIDRPIRTTVRLIGTHKDKGLLTEFAEWND